MLLNTSKLAFETTYSLPQDITAPLNETTTKEGLCPYHVEIEDGISMPFRAQITAYTKHSYTWDSDKASGILNLLNQKINLTITQTKGDNVFTLSRKLEGKITSIKYTGKMGDGTASNPTIYWYTLLVEPEFALLRNSRRSRSYYYKSPLDVIKSVLTEWGISNYDLAKDVGLSSSGQPSDLPNFSDYANYLMFDQIDSSDRDFLYSLLAMYGISFVFAFPDPPATTGGSSNTEETPPALTLWFSSGSTYPANLGTLQGETPVSGKLTFASKTAAGQESTSAFAIGAFSRESHLGIDGVSASSPYPDSKKTGNWTTMTTTEADSHSLIQHNKMPHPYQRDITEANIDKDINAIIGAEKNRHCYEKSSARGKAENILAIAGQQIAVGSDFAGRIRHSVTTVQSVWPSEFGNIPANSIFGKGEVIASVEFDAFATISETRYCTIPRDPFVIGTGI